MINYQERLDKLKANSYEWFKPVSGEYKIEILSEPEIVSKVFTNDKTGQPETKEQIELNFKCADKVYRWDVSEGDTLASVYGQLMLLGGRRNALKGSVLTLFVKSNKQRNGKEKNEYTIQEALQLMNSHQ